MQTAKRPGRHANESKSRSDSKDKRFFTALWTARPTPEQISAELMPKRESTG
jgi:hypothetical protein